MFLLSNSLDQVKYNFYLEICSLVFLIIFAIKFFSKRKFPNSINIVFSIAIICALLDVTLDIVASIMVNNINNFPILATEIVNGFFYCFQALFPALCALYVFTLSENSFLKQKWHIVLFLPAIIFFVIQALNPVHHWLFKIENVQGQLRFVHTDIFIIYYVMCLFYVLLSFIYTIVFKKHFDLKQRISIYALVSSIIIAIIIQLFIPNVLLTGTAITISIYISIEAFADPNHMQDRVTGVFNLEALLYYFKSTNSKHRHSHFLYIKIDNLTSIRQTFSLGVTNELCRQIGSFLNSFDRNNWVFRITNSSFLLLFDSEVNLQRAAYFSNIKFRTPWEANNNTFNLSIKMIKYTAKENDVHITELLETFDTAFTSQSFLNQNGVSIFDLDNNILDLTIRKKLVRQAVEKALKTGKGFSLRYQPIFNLQTKDFDYCEALLRLDDDEIGRIAPDEFIPIAEASGFAVQIDKFVLESVCKFSKLVPHINNFSINISGTEFFDNPSKDFSEICKKYDVNARKIIYEVTETAAVTHIDKIKMFIDDMRKEGSTFAIDDFGTGYSNMSQLFKFNIKKVKFDRSLLGEPNILQALFEMMNKLKIDVVMEGIETKEELDLVSKAGAKYIQGYYFSMPLGEEEFIKFIESKTKAK